MDTNQLLAGGFLIGLLAAFWSRIKTYASILLSRLVVTASLEGATAQAFGYHCWTQLRRGRFGGARRFGSFMSYIRPLKRHENVGYETVGKEPVIFWLGWRPVVVQFDIPKSGEPMLSNSGFPITVSFLRGTFDLDDVLIEALDKFNQFRHKGGGSGCGRFRVEKVEGNRMRRGQYDAMGSPGVASLPMPGNPVSMEETSPDRRLLRWRQEDIGAPTGNGDPFGALALTLEAEELVEAGRRWLASEDWYRAKRIPWRMGWLLYGKPGTGKSSLVRAFGQSCDLPVFQFDLSSFTNQDMSRQWARVLVDAPCVVLLEDIDGVFDGRTNVVDGDDGNGLTFDCLLNCISGVNDSSGILTVVTTNRVEMLDDALGRPDPSRSGFSTRPGRIDRAVEMPYLTEDGRRQVASRILSDYPDLVEGLVQAGDGDSGAQFEDRCGRAALDRYWEK